MEKNKFEENYENFNRRKPIERVQDRRRGYINYSLVNKWDTTHIRFVDRATKEEILQEYEFIKKKESDLSSKERSLIVNMVENGSEN